MTKKSQIITICLFVVVFLLGYSVSYLVDKSSINNSYTAGWNAAKQRVADVGFVPPVPANMPVESVSGTVQSINGDKITVKIHPLEVFADASLDTRTIDITSGTKMYSVTMVDQKTFAAEMNAFSKKMQTTGTNSATSLTPPSPTTKTAISLSDLKVGNIVSINTSSDIKEVKEFSATEIDVNNPTVVPTPAPAK